MMKKIFLFEILVILVSVSMLWARTMEYNYKDCKGYSCFMKKFEKWKDSELLSGSEGYEKIFPYRKKFSKKERINNIRLAKKIGEKLYNRHKSDIDKIIHNFDKLFNETLKPYNGNYSVTENLIDYSYSRSIIRTFVVISTYLYSQKRYKDSYKLLLLGVKFGVNVINGNECAPSIITRMIGIAIIKTSINKLLWRALYVSKSTPDEYYLLYKKMNGELSRMDNFEKFIESEKKAGLQYFKDNISAEEERNNSTPTLMNKISASNAKKILPIFEKDLNESYKKVLEIFKKNRDNCQKYNSEMMKFIKKLSEDSKPSFWSLFSGNEATAKMLVLNSIPNYHTAYFQYKLARIRLEFLVLYCKFLSKKDKKLVKISDLIKYINSNYRDCYNNSPLKVKKLKNSFLIYSVGKNMKDDGGKESSDDFVMIQLYSKKNKK